ncbi:lytic transglycosylase domain-containing protein [Kitasatospora sp. NPDC088351]|uniref:lytic transglycosylase domain-containing protein n=1 Tax=Kitasatospora sp. NPDC088351 TaxID=3155180 RepID=UPI003435B017
MMARFGSGQGGRRLRLGKRVTGTAAAFTALAALTGSQVTGLGLVPVAAADAVPPVTDPATRGSSFPVPPGTVLPTAFGTPGTGGPVDGGGPLALPQPPTTLPGDPSAGPFRTGPALPETVSAAYHKAEAALAQRSPGCHLPWQLLAAIGEVESGQADRGRVDAAGTTYRAILGPVLDGNGFAAIADTDGGRYDGDSRWDRAVGPMQFIPSTWAVWGVDANGDGKADPNNIFDAAEAAGRYLCAGGRNLSDPAQLDRAILSYNNSGEYLRTVKNWMAHFGSGTTTTTPDLPAAATPPTTAPTTTPTPVQPLPKPSSSAEPPVTQPSPSGSPSPTTTPTTVPTTTPGTTPTGTPTGTPTPTGSPSPSATATPTPSATPTATPTGTPTECPTTTPTAAPSGTPTTGPSPSASASATATPTAPGCATATPEPTSSVSATTSAPTAAATPTAGLSPSPTAR